MQLKPEEILKKARQKKKLTQGELAAKLGITLRQYHKYESGAFPKFKSESIKQIDSILGTNIYELIYEQKTSNEIIISGTLEKILRSQDEKILRLEAYVEVYELTIAELLSASKSDFPKKVSELRERVQSVVNRRFDELSKKSSG
jgi:transcriptional regulator with XRE-family HTH domain